MDSRIEKALVAAVSTFNKVSGMNENQFQTALMDVFNSEESYMQKVALLDDCFDSNPSYEDLRETMFDLLLMNFFAADVEKLEEDYLESEEWEDIEEQTIDRGTELLNLLLYLRECADEEIEPELDDFLKELLLVDEDEFQDEHRIYEPMIANQMLVDSSYEEISRIAAKLDDQQELSAIFYPIMSFFAEQNPSEQQFAEYLKASAYPAVDAAIYALVIAYNKN